MAKTRNVKWSILAFSQFEKFYYYLHEFYEQYAAKVRFEIFRKVEQVSHYPEHFSLEKYKTGNDGSYRYFELHHITVSYRLVNDEIRILSSAHKNAP